MNCTVTRRTVLNDRELRAVQVSFCKEEGKDDGGLTRHWFMLISRECLERNSATASPARRRDPGLAKRFRIVNGICV